GVDRVRRSRRGRREAAGEPELKPLPGDGYKTAVRLVDLHTQVSVQQVPCAAADERRTGGLKGRFRSGQYPAGLGGDRSGRAFGKIGVVRRAAHRNTGGVIRAAAKVAVGQADVLRIR